MTHQDELDVARERLAKATELLAAADRFVQVCSDITGIEFDPDDDEEWTLDDWLMVAMDSLRVP